MHIYDFLFIIQLVALVGLVLWKIYNVLSVGKAYDMRMAWIGFIGFMISWVIGLVIFLIQPERTIYAVLIRVNNFLLALEVLFLIIEILMNVGSQAQDVIKPYESLMNKTR